MALNQYCEFDEVRAALGVNSVELPNTVLSLPVYEIGLVRELAKVSASLPAAFLEVRGVAEGSRTEDQQALFDAARMFCVYACAAQVGVSLGAIAPKSVSDGKSSTARFSDSPYKDVLERVDRMLGSARATLVEAYVTLTGAGTVATPMTPAPVFSASRRSYDPVTGS